jgi:multiple sugar transport system substrate-binding protein
MRRIHRRRLLKSAGTLAAGGGLAGILASGRAPAFAQGTALHWLKFVDFVPVSDQLLKGKIRDDCKKALGIDLTIETINGDGVQARITSAIQSRSGADIMMAVSNWAQLYADSLVDVSDIAEAVDKAQGGFFQTSRDIAYDGKRWIAMPFTILGVCSPTAPRGLPRLASARTSFRRPGTSTGPPASS